MKLIKNIAILKPVVIFDKEDNINYVSKEGCIVIEYKDNTKSYLDLQNMVDLSKCDRYEYKVYKKTKIKFIFKVVE